jgi:hypothetical protein
MSPVLHVRITWWTTVMTGLRAATRCTLFCMAIGYCFCTIGMFTFLRRQWHRLATVAQSAWETRWILQYLIRSRDIHECLLAFTELLITRKNHPEKQYLLWGDISVLTSASGWGLVRLSWTAFFGQVDKPKSVGFWYTEWSYNILKYLGIPNYYFKGKMH